MLKPVQFRINHGKLKADNRFRIADTSAPLLSWAVSSDEKNAYQTAYRIQVFTKEEILWKTDWIESRQQEAQYAGKSLPIGQKIFVSVEIQDQSGTSSEKGMDYFFVGQRDDWTAPWIAATEDTIRKPIYFQKKFTVEKSIRSACLYACGIGYHALSINGKSIDPSVMDPAWTDYKETCCYVAFPEMESYLTQGENKLDCIVSDGWRRIDSSFLNMHTGTDGARFNGIPQLTSILDIQYEDGTMQTVVTDESWSWSHGVIAESNLYDGEVYDANAVHAVYQPVKIVDAPGGIMRVQTLEPIREKEIYPAIAVFSPKKDVFVVDFGQNIAGVVTIRLPKMTAGQKITIAHMEFLDEDGTLYMAPLREAKCTDTYIASGTETDLTEWSPVFTYHGFRYAQITGYGEPLERDAICAVARYTDIQNDSFFTCGNPLINQIHKNVVQTEKSNIHSVLTDCPQRDERLGWMNDATVRFEETPYNFDIGRIFPKIVRDLLDVQKYHENGEIRCTAPFFVGGNPADPVCSSFLVAGLEALLHTGNTAMIAESYAGYDAWENCLLAHSDDYIVNYSYYGDWAGPAYVCPPDDGANSTVTPGLLMSTGYSYFNCILLAKFAAILGKTEDKMRHEATAQKIKEAFLAKWYHSDTGMFAEGSQASQAFPLWLGLVPENDTAKVAEIIHKDLVEKDYKITTGNLCTRYLMDMLAKYGYLEDAWNILTREEYPSYGFMIQHEATTIWERFELKKSPGMNSHNHPMYGAVGYWFYAYLCGIQPTSPAWETVSIHPYFPEKLLSAHANVDTVKGDITVKWVKRYGKGYLYVKIPFGVTASVFVDGKTQQVGSGSHTFDWKL